MALTHKLIQTITVGATSIATIDFTSIPQTYTDLIIVASLRCDADSIVNQVRFNGSTSSLSTDAMNGNGSSGSGFSDASTIKMYGGMNASSFTASVFASTTLYIPNYTGAKNKIVYADAASETAATAAWHSMASGLWSSTAAINQVTFYNSSGNYIQYSSASLYGIKNS